MLVCSAEGKEKNKDGGKNKSKPSHSRKEKAEARKALEKLLEEAAIKAVEKGTENSTQKRFEKLESSKAKFRAAKTELKHAKNNQEAKLAHKDSAVKDLAKAERRYNLAKSNYDSLKAAEAGGSKVSKSELKAAAGKFTEASGKKEAAKASVTRASVKATRASIKVASAEGKLIKASKVVAKAESKYISSMVKAVGVKVGGKIAWFYSIFGDADDIGPEPTPEEYIKSQPELLKQIEAQHRAELEKEQDRVLKETLEKLDKSKRDDGPTRGSGSGHELPKDDGSGDKDARGWIGA